MKLREKNILVLTLIHAVAALCIVLVSAALFSSNVFASAKVNNVRLWNAPDHTRFVFELSQPVEHKVMLLGAPDRLVLDIKDASRKANLDDMDFSDSPVKNIRSATRNKDDLRVVFDLKSKVSPKSFLLKPNAKYSDRLVVDLYRTDKKAVKSRPVVKSLGNKKRDIVVVIDPGHGGEDPGAIGPNRVREKDIVLAISKELKSLIEKKKGYKAHLTRSGDYFIRLRDRSEKARKHNADLLVSVHADAFKKSQANGASVFALSNRGATSEAARWLAKKENASDLIGGVGGVSLDDKDDVLASVLLDLSSTASLKASLGVGEHVLKSMGGVARLHKKNVQQAGFVVLKSPDIPSILVETGFISNPAESRRLKTRKYQKKIAKAISTGLSKYFERTPPPGSFLASNSGMSGNSPRSYVVRKGDTLSHIAMKNDVSVKELRRFNGLSSNNVWVGQTLRVPSG